MMEKENPKKSKKLGVFLSVVLLVWLLIMPYVNETISLMGITESRGLLGFAALINREVAMIPYLMLIVGIVGAVVCIMASKGKIAPLWQVAGGVAVAMVIAAVTVTDITSDGFLVKESPAIGIWGGLLLSAGIAAYDYLQLKK